MQDSNYVLNTARALEVCDFRDDLNLPGINRWQDKRGFA